MFKIAQVGESVLRQPAQPVTDFNTPELIEFVRLLIESMLAEKGIGIAAPQVFDKRAIMVIASKANARYPDAPDMSPLVMINPTITSQSTDTEKAWEGCLSVPGLRGFIPRSVDVNIQYQDIKGQRHHVTWSGFLARIFLHEYDHLIGKTWLDRVEHPHDIIAETVYFSRLATA